MHQQPVAPVLTRFWTPPLAAALVTCAALLWGGQSPGYGLLSLWPLPPLLALLLGCLLGGAFGGKAASLPPRAAQSAANWLFSAALLVGSFTFLGSPAGASIHLSRELVSALLPVPWVAAGLGLAWLLRTHATSPARVFAAVCGASAIVILLGAVAGEWLDYRPYLPAFGAAAMAAAAGVAAHAAHRRPLLLLSVALAVGWLLFLLFSVPAASPAANAFGEIRQSQLPAWLAAGMVGVLILALFAGRWPTAAPWPPLPLINFLAWFWCIGAALVFMGVGQTVAPRAISGAFLSVVAILAGLAVPGFLIARQISARRLFFIFWAAFAGLLVVSAFALLPAPLIAVIADLPLAGLYFAALLFALALLLGGLIPAVFNLTGERLPGQVTWLWAAFLLAPLIAMPLSGQLSPQLKLNIGGGICVFVWLVCWRQSHTWGELWPGAAQRQQRPGTMPTAFPPAEPEVASRDAAAGLVKSTERLALGPLRALLRIARAGLRAVEHQLSGIWSKGSAGRRLALDQSSSALFRTARILILPVSLAAGAIERLIVLVSSLCRPAQRALTFVSSKLAVFSSPSRAAQQAPTRWAEQDFRLALELQPGHRYQFSGELWISGRECACIVYIQLERARAYKKVFVSRGYVDEQLASGREAAELQAILLRAGFRFAAAEAKARRFTSKTLNLEREAGELLLTAQDRWCDFRSATPSLGLGGAYLCSLSYPRDPCRGATTLQACRNCNVPELWERCAKLVISGTAGAERGGRLLRFGYFTCPEREGALIPQECLGRQCFSPTVVAKITWADLGRTA